MVSAEREATSSRDLRAAEGKPSGTWDWLLAEAACLLESGVGQSRPLEGRWPVAWALPMVLPMISRVWFGRCP